MRIWQIKFPAQRLALAHESLAICLDCGKLTAVKTQHGVCMIDLTILPQDFCQSRTPQSWLTMATNNVSTLLIDHAHCERKAADTGIRILKAYQDHPQLQAPISKLIREEMRHFEMVLGLLAKRGISFGALSASRYGQRLHEATEKNCRSRRLLDWMVIAALIEARSCERFFSLYPLLDDELGRFYFRLYEAEKRHFQMYLQFAYDLYPDAEVDERIRYFLALEDELINQPEAIFRFHSGPPSPVNAAC